MHLSELLCVAFLSRKGAEGGAGHPGRKIQRNNRMDRNRRGLTEAGVDLIRMNRLMTIAGPTGGMAGLEPELVFCFAPYLLFKWSPDKECI
jgi:hypothetical protein